LDGRSKMTTKRTRFNYGQAGGGQKRLMYGKLGVEWRGRDFYVKARRLAGKKNAAKEEDRRDMESSRGKKRR